MTAQGGSSSPFGLMLQGGRIFQVVRWGWEPIFLCEVS